jgi:hypothetical protein
VKISAPARGAFCLAVCIVILGACAGSARAQARSYTEGPCGSVFGVKVCTFYQTRSGKVTEFGLNVPVAAIRQAPANPPMVWPPKADVSVPFARVVEEQTGFTFANIYSEAHGHPPGAYMVPHFDFHFYFVPEQEVQKIDCKDSGKPRILPAGYALPDVNAPPIGELVGMCVPAMGMHAIPKTDLDAKAPWAASMLVGYYSRKPIFVEPMVTRALILQEHTFSLKIPEIAPVPHVRYPRHFRAVYLPKSKTYHMILSY